MTRERRKPHLPNSVYIAYFGVTARAVLAAGFEPLTVGPILTAREMDRLDEWCESGKPAEDFAAWIVARRIEARNAEDALSSENLGNETVALSEVAA